MKGAAIVFTLVLLWCGLVASQPIPKSSWKVINEQPARRSSFPRVTSFSNGDYAAVYAIGVSPATNFTTIVAKIFNSDGSVKVPEMALSTTTTSFNYAPNIIVMGDVAIASWRTLTSPTIWHAQFLSNGTVLQVTSAASLVPTNLNDILGLFPIANTIFGMTVSPTDFATGIVRYYEVGSTNPIPPYQNTLTVDIPTGIYDPRRNSSIYFEPNATSTPVYVHEGYYGSASGTVLATLPPSYYILPYLVDSPDLLPFVIFDAQRLILSLMVLNRVDGTVVTQRDLFSRFNTKLARPDVLYLGSNYALIAQSTRNNSVGYRLVRLNGQRIEFVGSSRTDFANTSDGASMARVGKDIVVTAYNVERTQVMTRVLTFCGNGVLDFDEECDDVKGCTTECQCEAGTTANNGVCVDQCGNGVVTGNEDCDSSEGCDPITCKCQAGYQPLVIQKTCTRAEVTFVPSVGPSLDCLTFVDNGDGNPSVNLFFSFTSNDPFDQTIEHGPMNNVIPSDLATNRPTFFASGTSPTYPVSPYNVTIPRSVTQLTWLLGSYNLTVDLSGNKADALQCPKDAIFVLSVTSYDELNDTDVDQLLVNIANNYNISSERLDATYRLSSVSTETAPNVYSVSIIIAGSLNPSDTTSADVVINLYSDLTNSKQQTQSELTLGLDEKNPQLKDVTPAPTGVEVRGQQRDIPPSTLVPPPSATLIPSSSPSKLPSALLSELIVALLVATKLLNL